MSLKTLVLTSLAMTAFAANSIFCRFALGEGGIDAGTFTLIRLISGAIVLGFFRVDTPSSHRSQTAEKPVPCP